MRQDTNRQSSLKNGGQRIAIVGTSGSGKTTLARRIAQRAHIPHIELDALYWEPHWTPAPAPVFRSRVATATQGDRWVVDGNYSVVRDIVWGRADTVIFLDYPFWLVLGRLLRRSWQRSRRQQDLWNGNREDFRRSFFSQDSIVLWMLQTYDRNRRLYPQLFQQPDYAHLNVIQVRSPSFPLDDLLSASLIR